MFNALFNYLQSLPGNFQYKELTTLQFRHNLTSKKMNSLGNKLSADTERGKFCGSERNLNYFRSRKKKTSEQQQTLSDLCSALHCRKMSAQLFHHPAKLAFLQQQLVGFFEANEFFCFVPFYRREIMDYQAGHYAGCYLPTWINSRFSLSSGYGFGAPENSNQKRETRSQGIKLKRSVSQEVSSQTKPPPRPRPFQLHAQITLFI